MPCAVLDGSFADDAVSVQALSAVVLPAILGSPIGCKLILWLCLVAPSAVFGFHGLSSMISFVSSCMASMKSEEYWRIVVAWLASARLSTSSMNCSRWTYGPCRKTCDRTLHQCPRFGPLQPITGAFMSSLAQTVIGGRLSLILLSPFWVCWRILANSRCRLSLPLLYWDAPQRTIRRHSVF